MIALLIAAPLFLPAPTSALLPMAPPAMAPAPATPLVHGAKFPLPEPPPPGNPGGYKGPEGPGSPPKRGTPPRARGPATPNPGPAGGTPPPTGPSTRTPGAVTLDRSHWSYWWNFNGARWLELRSHVNESGAASRGEELFLGHGPRQAAPRSLAPTDEQVDDSVIPILREALAGKPHTDMLTASLVAQGKIGRRSDESPAAFIARFTPHLRSANQEVAETAALALGMSAEPAAVATLRDLMLETSRGKVLVGKGEVPYRTRAFAAYGLGLIAMRSTSPDVRQFVAEQLVSAVEDHELATPDLEVAAVTALGLVPLTSEPLIPRMDSGRRPGPHAVHVLSLRTQVSYLMGLIDRDRVRKGGPHWLVRAHAVTALGRLLENAPEGLRATVMPTFLRILRDASREPRDVRLSALLALGQAADSDDDALDAQVRDTLARMSRSGQLQERRFALMSLARVAGREGTGEQGDGRADCRRHLLRALTDGRTELRSWAALGLGVIGRGMLELGESPDASTSRALRHAADDCKRPQEIGAFALALGLRRDVEGVQIIETKLEEMADPAARGTLILALGLLGERRSIEKVREIVADSKYKPELLWNAAIGLALLGDKESVPQLLDMLREAKGLGSQAALASGLGLVGDARSIDPLVAMAGDQTLTQGARTFATVALGLVCDRQLLPWNFPLSEGSNYIAPTSTFLGTANGVLNIR